MLGYPYRQDGFPRNSLYSVYLGWFHAYQHGTSPSRSNEFESISKMGNAIQEYLHVGRTYSVRESLLQEPAFHQESTKSPWIGRVFQYASSFFHHLFHGKELRLLAGSKLYLFLGYFTSSPVVTRRNQIQVVFYKTLGILVQNRSCTYGVIRLKEYTSKSSKYGKHLVL